MHDLVDPKGCGRGIRIGLIVAVQLIPDMNDPRLKALTVFFSSVQSRKGSDNARLALRNDQLRPRNDEERCAEQWKAKVR